MPKHPFTPLKGKLVSFTLDSDNLKKNLLGDPSTRTVTVYLPEGYEETNKEYPLFMSLAAFTGSGLKQLAWKAYEETLPLRLERLIKEEKMGSVICVFPDAFTSLGGNQYINSEAMGHWADFIHKELIPSIESKFRVNKDPKTRAVFGKSSGGYGALIYGMKYASQWGAIACQSGDIDFELLYKAEFPRCLTTLAAYNYDIEQYLQVFEESDKMTGDTFCTLMCLAMCASYAPNPEKPKGIELPVDLETCEIKKSLWDKWLEHDPLHLVDEKSARENLFKLKAIFIDCGFRDQYHLHYGARKLCKKLDHYSVPYHYEEFNGTHSGIDHRLDVSLPHLYKAIS